MSEHATLGRPRHVPGGYPITLVREARLLAHEGGWGPAEIVRIFARRGVDPLPSPSAVRWWLAGSNDFVGQMEQQRRYKARKTAEESGGRLRSRACSPELKFVRMRELRKLPGMSYQAIASVIRFDFGDPITPDQVEWALEHTGHYPRRLTTSTEHVH